MFFVFVIYRLLLIILVGHETLQLRHQERNQLKDLQKEVFLSLVSSVVDTHTDETLRAVGRKIEGEISCICSHKGNNILKGDKKCILNFSWKNIYRLK